MNPTRPVVLPALSAPFRLIQNWVGWAAGWFLVSSLALLQTSPWVNQTPGNDSGIFLYFGSEILKGKLPFVDLWDHKPPLVFYLNALGLALTSGSRWGVWALEVAALGLGSTALFFCLRRYFRTWPAFLGTAGLLLNLAFVLEGGNLTEEYALAFQLGGLWLFAGAQETPRLGWRGLWIGLLMGCAFLLKQTLVGIWAAMVIYWLAEALFARRNTALKKIAQVVAGFLAVVGVSFAYFALRGGLGAYWDVAFGFNFIYSAVSTPERLESLATVLTFMSTRSGFFILGGMAWVGAVVYLLSHHPAAARLVTRRWVGVLPLVMGLVVAARGLFARGISPAAFTDLSPYRWGLLVGGLVLLASGGLFLGGFVERQGYLWLARHQAAGDPLVRPLLYLALLDLPIELLVISLSGRGYLHYDISLLPSLAVLTAFLAGTLFDWGQPAAGRQIMPAVWSILLVIPLLSGGLAQTVVKIHPGADRQTSETARYIRQNTQAGETVLLWGSQTGLYYLSGRESPTRYVHQVPFVTPRYATPQRVAEFLGDIEHNRPALIIDTRQNWFPLPYQAGDPTGCIPTGLPQLAKLETVYAFICTHYEAVDTIGPDSWIIYRYNPDVQPAVNH